MDNENNPGNNNNDIELKKFIFSFLSNSASDFYKSTVTVASFFLGGSIVFIEKIAPNPDKGSKIFLAIGWFSLTLCILSISFVQRWNLKSGTHALNNKFNKSKQIDIKTDIATTFSIITLFAGIFMIAFFAFINLF